MATLSSGSFLPSGAFDTEMSFALGSNHPYGNPSPIPSPSSLPKSRSHYNRMESMNMQQNHQQPRSTDTYPLSLASLRASYASQNSSNFPPHSQFDTSSNSRATSLSPSQTSRVSDLPHPSSSKKHLASIPAAIAATNLGRSVSADAVAVPSQTSVHIVQRLAQQNALIREAWEAERNHLEANRRRAEEVYQEERLIMEDMKDGWESEKISMLHEIQALKERVQRLEGENSTLKAVTAQSVQVTGVVSPLASVQGGNNSGNNSSPSLISSRMSSRSQNHGGLSLADLPPGLDGASRRPHMLSPGSSRISPTSHADASYFVPLDPRMQPQHPNPRDFLPTSPSLETPVPIIDVQEIDPKLEGIPIKAPAVQKSTFECGTSPPPSEVSKQSSPATSPRTDPRALSRTSSREQTLQVLQAGENRRLTMHAGHTPNHSLSLFPTVNATETSTINGQSEGATPTAESMAFASRQLGEAKANQEDTGKGKAILIEDDRRRSSIVDAFPVEEFGDPEPLFEPRNDRKLKGPLMIRNMPAQDELFWAAVNKKLEPISQGQNALPTVMQVCLEQLESEAGPSTLVAPKSGVHVGGDGSQDAHALAEEEDQDEFGSKKKMEPDVPLKFKSTSNFGAPFGVM